MFKRQVQTLDEILQKALREGGLETPLRQRRLIDAWSEVVGQTVNAVSYTHLTLPTICSV